METYQRLYEAKKRIAAKCEFVCEAVQPFIIAFGKIAQMNCPQDIAAGNAKKMTSLVHTMQSMKARSEELLKARRQQADNDRVLYDKLEKLDKEKQAWEKKATGKKKEEAETQIQHYQNEIGIIEVDIKKAYAEMEALENQTNELITQFYTSFKPANNDIVNVFAAKSPKSPWNQPVQAVSSQEKSANDLLDFAGASISGGATEEFQQLVMESSVSQELTYDQQLQIEWERQQAMAQQAAAQQVLPVEEVQQLAAQYDETGYGAENYQDYNAAQSVQEYDPFRGEW